MGCESGFTKKDLLVSLLCIAFLFLIAGFIGNGGRRRAKEAVCLSHLRQWGIFAREYANDNDGHFWIGAGQQSGHINLYDYNDMWMAALKPYYGENEHLRCCPMAVEPQRPVGAPLDGYTHWPSDPRFKAWGAFAADIGYWAEPNMYGSYGLNSWIHYVHPKTTRYSWNDYINAEARKTMWQEINVKGAQLIPLMMDAGFFDTWPDNDNLPPEYDGDYQAHNIKEEIKLVCINRHNVYVNIVFMDGSARKVGLKELWKLKWNRRSDLNAPTPEWSEWMEDFKDYD